MHNSVGEFFSVDITSFYVTEAVDSKYNILKCFNPLDTSFEKNQKLLKLGIRN